VVVEFRWNVARQKLRDAAREKKTKGCCKREIKGTAAYGQARSS
jgi:hypothetical protein